MRCDTAERGWDNFTGLQNMTTKLYTHADKFVSLLA